MSLPCSTRLPSYSTVVEQKLISFHRPCSISIHHNPFSKTCPLRLRAPKASTRIIKMAYLGTDYEGIPRRTRNHHPNVWDDDFLQSLSITYDAPSYVERAERLIEEIKGMFNALPQNTSSSDDLYKRLSLVDDVERLGIDRHFQTEIKEALDYVYRYWNDINGIGCGRESPCIDLNTTALGFRILRLHRYGVSSDMLSQFKDSDGKFVCSNIQSNEEELRSILNLYRASPISFPKEKILDDAKFFSTTYLKQALRNNNNINIMKEIKFNLEYGWHTNVPRLEARTYIDIYGNAKTMNSIFNSNFLELAKIDFNMIQSIQHRELQILSRWWIESGLAKLEFARQCHVEFYFIAATVCSDPNYSTFRIGFAKMCTFLTCLDDIYDTYGTLDELKLFTQAIKRWDLASMKGLPEYMKVAFNTFDEGVRSMAREAQKTQGRDTLDYARKAWEACIDSFMQEATWLATGYIPSLEEYLENGKVSSGSRVVTLQPILSLDVPIYDDIIKEIDYPSKFNDLLCLALRLRNDTNTFKVEADYGEAASCVTCYLKDNPRSTEEEALEYLNSLIDEKLKELNWEYLKPDNVPRISKDHGYAISKGIQLLYKERDGISVSSIETKNLIAKTIFEPISM